MIYSAGLSGHRQVYCDALTEVFLELGFDVILVVGLLSDKNGMKQWKHIERYLNNVRVKVFDTYTLSPTNGKLSVEQIRYLQKQEGVSVTLFPCGDEMRSEFAAIADGSAPKLLGKNMAVFGLVDGWYPMDGPFANGLHYKERLRTIRNIIWTRQPVRQFYERVIRTKKVLEIAFLKDERVAQLNKLPFVWWPEIYRPYGWNTDINERAEFDAVIPMYQNFLKEHPNKEILLYFGAASRLKGYDSLLRLAAEDPSTVFVLCGTQNLRENYDEDVRSFLSTLKEEERFFETNRRIIGWETVDYFFSSIRYFVSTHRFYGSSGTVLQALHMGKPVLTPNRGIIGYRTTRNKLGRIYNPNKNGDLLIQWETLKKDPYNQYHLSIQNYIRNFSKKRVMGIISQALSASSS